MSKCCLRCKTRIFGDAYEAFTGSSSMCLVHRTPGIVVNAASGSSIRGRSQQVPFSGSGGPRRGIANAEPVLDLRSAG